MITTMKEQWFSNVKGDVLAGIVVALALIPEAIAFSIIAGVDPMVGLYASFSIAIIMAFVGGRTGMISAATGSMALLMVPLVKEYGLDYLLAATILTGLIQLLFGVFKVAKVMRFIPNAVMIGFVNALAILIFLAQMPHLKNASIMTYVFVGITIAILYILPRFIKAIPAPLVAIVLLTAVAIYTSFDLRTVGDLGTISKTLPHFFLPDIPFNFETLRIIFPFSLALAIVGLLESLMTASILDDMTGTSSNKNKEARGQGVANIINGFFGGMAGCAMIGQSVINIKSGGRGRLSTLISGVFLLFLIIVLGDIVVQIPMAVLVGIMIVVTVGTFDWSTFSYMKKAPKSDVFIMLATVSIVVATHDLSKGVFSGVILSAIFFVVKISKITLEKQLLDEEIIYKVKGQMFFASTESFIKSFDYLMEDQTIIIDFENTKIWDDSAVLAIDKVVLKLREKNNVVFIRALDSSSTTLVKDIAITAKTKTSLFK